ncbi:MAG: type II secretion system minor pseudopilin GspJ [Nitrosospira sp.]|nr:type II secretion system minor pseudopilin GspJ [Nitrosospira sp.]
MKPVSGTRVRGFTLIELLAALIILSLLALISYRGLSSVLDAREYVARETEKWRRVTAFLARFERDVQLAAPRPVRAGSTTIPAWRGIVMPMAGEALSPYLEFSRFGSAAGTDTARRIAYRHNDKQEIELWLWPGLDSGPGVAPLRYPVLTGVTKLDLHYLTANLAWVETWPVAAAGSAVSTVSSVPHAVRVRIALASGEVVERIFQ